MAENNDSKWDKNFVAAVVAIVVGAVVTIATPELRKLFCLEKDNPAPQQQTVQTVPQPSPTPAASAQPALKTTPPKTASQPRQAAAPKPKPPVIHEAAQEPAGPYQCTIGDNKSQRIKEANAELSVAFHDEYKTASITIAPDGKDSGWPRPVLNGYTEEFASSTGVFLVHILNVDWNSRTVTVQVSRKSS